MMIFREFAGFLERGQEQPDENRDNSDYHEQLDECESGSTLHDDASNGLIRKGDVTRVF
jgi:hypothetical protein